jgi:hypothetical protein
MQLHRIGVVPISPPFYLCCLDYRIIYSSLSFITTPDVPPAAFKTLTLTLRPMAVDLGRSAAMSALTEHRRNDGYILLLLAYYVIVRRAFRILFGRFVILI